MSKILLSKVMMFSNVGTWKMKGMLIMVTKMVMMLDSAQDDTYDANADTCDDNDDDSCNDNDDDSGDVFNVGACNQRDMKEGDHVTEAFHL